MRLNCHLYCLGANTSPDCSGNRTEEADKRLQKCENHSQVLQRENTGIMEHRQGAYTLLPSLPCTLRSGIGFRLARPQGTNTCWSFTLASQKAPEMLPALGSVTFKKNVKSVCGGGEQPAFSLNNSRGCSMHLTFWLSHLHSPWTWDVFLRRAVEITTGF